MYYMDVVGQILKAAATKAYLARGDEDQAFQILDAMRDEIEPKFVLRGELVFDDVLDAE